MTTLPRVIYGQDVLYAARGQDARSRDGQDVLYAARGQDARSRPAQAGIQAGDTAVARGWRVLPDGIGWGRPLVVMPAVRAGLV